MAVRVQYAKASACMEPISWCTVGAWGLFLPCLLCLWMEAMSKHWVGWDWGTEQAGLAVLGSGLLETGAMVGCGVAGSVGNHAACEVLSAAAGVTASTVRTGSLPVAPKQSLAAGEQSGLMTDAERLVHAGPGGGGWERPAEAALCKAAPVKAGPGGVRIPAPCPYLP